MWTTLADSRCEVGESPFWHPEERSLYWLDIAGRAVLRTRGDIAREPAVERWAMPSEPGCMAPARRGGLVIALRDGIYRAAGWGEPLVRLAVAGYDIRTQRFNDGKCDALGRFWAGTINEAKDGPTAALYRLDARGPGEPSFHRVAGDVTNANGLAFAADGRTVYWADTTAHVVRVFDFGMEPGTLSRPRDFHRFAPKPDSWSADSPARYGGRPDGASLDADGHYWVALFEGAHLMRFAPDGTPVASIAVPVRCPTMPCFGGDDLRTLFVTSARHGRTAAELAQHPASGSVLSMRVERPGTPVAFFED